MAEKQVVLKNIGKMVFEQTLYHSIVCKKLQRCLCTPLPSVTKGAPKRKEASIILHPGEKSQPLPAVVQRIPQIRAAVGKTIAVEEVLVAVEEV